MSRIVVCASLLVAVWIAVSQVQPVGATAREAMTSGPAFGCDVLVQGAMDVEIQPLLDALEGAERIQIAAWTFWKGRIGPQRVVVSRTEVGPTNAAIATVLGIERFRPRLVINQGTAGGHVSDVKVGDIVLGSSCIEYGAFTSSHGDAGTGVKIERWQPRYNRFRLDGEKRTTLRGVPGDEAALAVAEATPYEGGRLVRGRIGSAHQWNRELDLIAWNHTKFGTVSEDMESAFSAMAARALDTRFVAIRIISDNELLSPDVKIDETGPLCAKYVVEVIKNLARSDMRQPAE
ncbi:MAG TPA: 5'-methylthioadenosine/S-adenosylhomocysteine nucleosidase [Phycisphaerae bacterium]|nr:5'-methylthioadenosine/S-adenosylhomocysteine nucleosidase [Phycisphaerae bacterium]